MFISKIIYRSLSIIGLSFVFSISAFAQSTILVVDTGRVLRDSDVGKHISTQLASIGSSMQSETQAKTSAMESKGKSLNEELKGKTQEDLKNDPALLSKVQSFQKEQQELSKWIGKTEVELKASLGKPDRIDFENSRNRHYVYVSQRLKIKCERKFEINKDNVILGFSSKNCF